MKAKKVLARFAVLHPYNISQKVVVIVEHFREHVATKIGGKAKAMVVTDSRKAAVRYKLAMDKYIKERGYDKELRALVAFSGKVDDPEFRTRGIHGTQHEHDIKGQEPSGVQGRHLSCAAGRQQVPNRISTSPCCIRCMSTSV